MAPSDHDDLPRIEPPEEFTSLEEPSQGSFSDLADMVDMRPELSDVGGLQLNQPIVMGDDLVLEAEHLFGASPLFEDLEPDEIREIVQAAEKMPLQAGDVLFHQGDDAAAMYILQSGEVQVRAASPMGEDIVLAVLGSGTVVGELALIDGGPRSATVDALSDCDVYRLDRGAFNALRRQRRHAAYKVILRLAATVDDRRRQAEARIDEVFEDPEQHIDTFQSQVHELLARLRKV